MTTGLLTFTNLFSWGFVFRIFLMHHGKSEEPQKCTNYTGPCKECGKATKFPRALFCANFCWTVGGFPACQSSWCATCYFSYPELKFHKAEDPRRMHPDPTVNAKWKNKKVDHKEYEVARPGDGLLVPFQCDVCVFRRIRKEEPDSSSVSDRVLLMYIRRANLDVFWSRAPKTVANELGNATRNIRNISFLKLSGPYYDPGPAPSSDSCGYEAAVSLLVDSQQPGRYHDSHKQWESVRKLRSTISNFERTSFGVSQVALVADDNGSTTRFRGGGTSSYWFNRFAQGIGNRMGSDIRNNVTVSTELGFQSFRRKFAYRETRRKWVDG